MGSTVPACVIPQTSGTSVRIPPTRSPWQCADAGGCNVGKILFRKAKVVIFAGRYCVSDALLRALLLFLLPRLMIVYKMHAGCEEPPGAAAGVKA